MESEKSDNISYEMDENDTGFLENLTSDKFVAKPDKEAAKLQKQQEKEAKRDAKQLIVQLAREAKQQAKIDKQAQKQPKASTPHKGGDDDNDSLFGDTSTPMLGRDRIVLLTKVKQFKTLFGDNPEIKKFKLKKNPSVQELNDAIIELQAIVDTGSVESFCEGAILSAIQMTEGMTAHSNYDLTGLSMMLKANKEFHNLCKILYIKYSIFSKVPPEIQMVMIVSITASLCIQKNRKKGDINAYLNSTIG